MKVCESMSLLLLADYLFVVVTLAKDPAPEKGSSLFTSSTILAEGGTVFMSIRQGRFMEQIEEIVCLEARRAFSLC